MPVSAPLIIANRAYGDHTEPPGNGRVAAGAGGLVAAVSSAIEPWDGKRGTLWIGTGRGPHDREFVDERGFELLETRRGPLLHQRLFFDDDAWAGHYEKVANSFLWPALHLVREGLTRRAAFFPRPVLPTERDWQSYVRVNRAFAEAAAASGRPAAWVQDYQLALVPRMLRERGYPGRIGFYLHTPFPAPEFVEAETNGSGIERFAAFVEGILGADLAGFQTDRDCRNFAEAAHRLCDATAAEGGLFHEGRTVALRCLPVGVNGDDVRGVEPLLPPEAQEAAQSGLPLVVGLERADFTKGIPERLQAMARAYAEGARFAYVGAASPTRSGVDLYNGFSKILAAARDEAAEAARRARCPFVHQESALPWETVVALLAAADVVFTSSLADGMNLVPLQAAVAQARRPSNERGVVIAGQDAGVSLAFSRFAGQGLVSVDPLDVEATAATLRKAVEGSLPGMSDAFVRAVEEHDAARWAADFLEALEGADAPD